MAIDTEAKRRSVQAYTFGLMRPVATGSLNSVAVRATQTWLYAAASYASGGGGGGGRQRGKPFLVNTSRLMGS